MGPGRGPRAAGRPWVGGPQREPPCCALSKSLPAHGLRLCFCKARFPFLPRKAARRRGRSPPKNSRPICVIREAESPWAAHPLPVTRLHLRSKHLGLCLGAGLLPSLASPRPASCAWAHSSGMPRMCRGRGRGGHRGKLPLGFPQRVPGALPLLTPRQGQDHTALALAPSCMTHCPPDPAPPSLASQTRPHHELQEQKSCLPGGVGTSESPGPLGHQEWLHHGSRHAALTSASHPSWSSG